MNTVRNKWTIFYIIALSAAFVFALFTYMKYVELKNIQYVKNEKDVANVDTVTEIFLTQFEVMLQDIGMNLAKSDLEKDRETKSKMLDDLRDLNPLILGFGFMDANGNLLVTNTNMDSKKINKIIQSREIKDSFEEVFESKNLVIGKSFYFKPLDKWILPIRKAIRDKNGTLLGLMNVGILNTKKKNLFSNFKLDSSQNIVLIKKYGSRVYRLFDSNAYNRQRDYALYSKECPQNICQSVVKQILAQYYVKLEDVKESQKSFSFDAYDLNNRPVMGALKYNAKYKIWAVVYSYNTKIRQEIYKDIIYLILLYIAIMWMFYLLFRSIEQYEKKKEDDLIFRTTHDTLTGLANRVYIYENFYHFKKLNMQEGARIIFVDIDNFKNINDKFGHSFGDKILIGIAKRLQRFFDENDLIARLGGDEFIIINNSKNKDLEEMINIISMPYIIDDAEVRIGASVGVAVYTVDANDFDTLLSFANLAMYEAKKVKNSYAFFTKEMQKKNSLNIEIEQELRSALQKSEIYMMYQPQIAADGTLHGVEALVRWKNQKLGNVGPDKFISVAEASGLILELGAYILRQSLMEVKQLYLESGKIFQLSVNISVIQLMNKNFVKELLQIIDETGFDKSLLTLELTEHLPIEDIDYVLPVLKELRGENIKLSLDDFGTGYSSLSILEQLPINELKIDKIFIDEMLSSKKDKNLVKTIIDIGKNFSMSVLAEGTENEEEINRLKRYGCDIFQGYYFSKPLKKEELLEFIRSFSDRRQTTVEYTI